MNLMTAFTAETAYGTYGRRDRIRIRRGILGCGAGYTVALTEQGTVKYAGENRWGQKASADWQDMLAVYSGPDYVLGLCRDGAVLTAGRCSDHGINVNSWACVSAISCGQKHAAALLANGQILASGNDQFGQCRTEHWNDMVGVCCGRNFTVGLKRDGRLLVAGGHKPLHHILEHWKQVAGVFVDSEGKHVLAITYGDGRLMSTGYLPACTRRWRNLVYVAASARGVVAITAQGRLLSTRREDAKKLEQLGKDYTACAMGPAHVAVLCRSGEVASVGHNEYGQCATARWGALFKSFEDYSSRRRMEEQKKEHTEKLYQQRLSEAKRCLRRMACGERLTACIQADGRVSATAGLRLVKSWKNVCALSCGSAHILALHKDGSVSADGNNVNGCCHVGDWRRVKAIQTGKYHSLGLTEDGRVLFAGWNIHGQGNVTEWRGIRLLRSFDTYTVGVAADGTLYTSGKTLPFDPALLDKKEWTDLLDLALSEHHMVGLRKDGHVVGVGDETCPNRGPKGELTDLRSWHGVRAIAVGDGFTAGLCYGGHVLAAGRDHYGQCDTASWSNIVSIGCGRSYTAGLTADGCVITAGQHVSDQGQNLSPDEISSAVMAWEKAESTGYEPFDTHWMTDILALQCGPEHIVTVDRYGQVMAEGLDLDGQCTAASAFVLFRDLRQLDGFGIFTTSMDLPQNARDGISFSGKEDLADATDPVKVSAEGKSTVSPGPLLLRDRTASALAGRVAQSLTYTVFLTNDGHLESPSICDRVASQSVKQHTYRQVAAGLYYTVALTHDGRLESFGHVPDDCDTALLEQAARNATPDVSEPLRWLSVSCGGNHLAAVAADGRVFAVGENAEGQCATASWRDMRQVVCGHCHTVAITRDHRVVAAGRNTHGQCTLNDWQNVVMVACGDRHTVGLLADGRVVAAGDNRLGQCRVEHLRNIAYVACLPEATLCVARDGTVRLIGGTGELAEKIAALRDVVAVYPCEYRVTALTGSGKLIEVNKLAE